jgi:hypothetical protein
MLMGVYGNADTWREMQKFCDRYGTSSYPAPSTRRRDYDLPGTQGSHRGPGEQDCGPETAAGPARPAVTQDGQTLSPPENDEKGPAHAGQ